jgi:hypothetical protein
VWVTPDTLERGLHNVGRNTKRNAVKERVADVKEALWKVASPLLNSALFALVSHDV